MKNKNSKRAKDSLPAPKWTECGQNANWVDPAYHYGEAPPNTQDGDLYVIDARELYANWAVVRSYPESESRGEDRETEIICLMRNLPRAMEQAQRVYWGAVYKEVIGYNAHEDDKNTTSLDMIVAMAFCQGSWDASSNNSLGNEEFTNEDDYHSSLSV